jgi:hypothetical protein
MRLERCKGRLLLTALLIRTVLDDVSTAEAVAGYRNLLEVAPDEVRPNLEVVIEYFEAIDPAGKPPTVTLRWPTTTKPPLWRGLRSVRSAGLEPTTF